MSSHCRLGALHWGLYSQGVRETPSYRKKSQHGRDIYELGEEKKSLWSWNETNVFLSLEVRYLWVFYRRSKEFSPEFWNIYTTLSEKPGSAVRGKRVIKIKNYCNDILHNPHDTQLMQSERSHSQESTEEKCKHVLRFWFAFLEINWLYTFTVIKSGNR